MINFDICLDCEEYQGTGDYGGWFCALVGDIADETFWVNEASDLPERCPKKLEQCVKAGMKNARP